MIILDLNLISFMVVLFKAGIVEILQTATNEDMDKDPFEDLDTTIEDD